MYCNILQTLFLKSNGELVCEDDYGQRIVLGEIGSTAGEFDADTYFTNEKYTHIRTAFRNQELPWNGVCEKGALLNRKGEMQDLVSLRRIRKLQLEVSLACNLVCPCCSNADQRKHRTKPHLMPEENLLRFLRSLKRQDYRINCIEYCGQGEPLMHPRFADLIDGARSIYPDARQRLITNGNFSYGKSLEGRALDEIIVSCDGVQQDNYVQYRRKGNVDKVINFMREAARASVDRKQDVIWKYILFEFNDSDEEIIKAQHLAQELGVTTLLFFITHSRFHSKRFKAKTIQDFPILYPNVSVRGHSALKDQSLHAERTKSSFAIKHHRWLLSRRREYRACLDDLNIFPGGLIYLRGWAAGYSRVDAVEVALNGKHIGRAEPQYERPDVFRAFPSFAVAPAGFRLTSTVENVRSGTNQLRLDLYSNSQCVGSLTEEYEFT